MASNSKNGSEEVFDKLLEWGLQQGLENFIDDVTLSTTWYESDWSGTWREMAYFSGRPNMSNEERKKRIERSHKRNFEHERTALHIAASYGHKGIIDKLLKLTNTEKLKGLLQKKDSQQKTALHLAVHNWDIAKTLLHYGADITELNDEHRQLLALRMSQE